MKSRLVLNGLLVLALVSFSTAAPDDGKNEPMGTSLVVVEVWTKQHSRNKSVPAIERNGCLQILVHALTVTFTTCRTSRIELNWREGPQESSL